MSDGRYSRRDVLRFTGGAGAAALLGAKRSSAFAAPAVIRQTGEPDLSDPAKVGEALQQEGAEVVMHTWGFSGLKETVLPDQFAKYTEALYGVPVKLSYQDLANGIVELPLAGRHVRELGFDVIDKEEEFFSRIMALEWAEPVDQEQYLPLLTNLASVEDPWIFRG